ncbi:response regulator transcription factor [Geomonas anaerohicana]|uniref:Response regulator transcription factor n=1 Tax=Geomonas anaerohicana TaxID=2798583 RepID=A0ABS0YGB8_9BACT|nr:response regulator transcription factor [Geomonas anaerohicana]MBJ6751376.1 response regulator transcription factor [Geomonas anaerohicana]
MSIKILLADDHHMFREGMRVLLEREHDMTVVAEADDGLSAVDLALETLPDVAILDLSMPGLKGTEVASRIIEKAPQVEVIILTMHSDRQYVVEALKLGVKSFILKEWAFHEVITAVRCVSNHASYLSHRLSDTIISGFTDEHSVSKSYNLTPREEQTYRLLVTGKNCKEIAYELNLCIKTVETYRLKLMKKLKVTNIAQLVNHAVQDGIVGRS